jgi:hypothetical protein
MGRGPIKASGYPTGYTVRHTERITNRKRHLRGVFLPAPDDTALRAPT